MHQMSELILFTNVKCLEIRSVLGFIEHTSESRFDLRRRMQLQDTIIEQSRQPFAELLKWGLDGLGLLKVDVRLLIQSHLVNEMRVFLIGGRHHLHSEVLCPLRDLAPDPLNCI